jgi:NTE family protein
MVHMLGNLDAQNDLAERVRAWEREKKVDIVCQGGGVLGIGLVGALQVLEEQGFKPQNLAGTSAGAIVATLLAAGYSAGEVKDIVFGLDFTRITDPTVEERLPLLGPSPAGLALSVLLEHGLYAGDYFLEFIRTLLNDRGVRTFGDLIYDDRPDVERRFRHKVQVIASDVSDRQLLRLPLDAPKLGIEPDRFPVAEAVRMSMSIPFFFRPVEWNDTSSGARHVVVDGGMLSNFPVWLFDEPGIPAWPTLGIKLVSPAPRDEITAPPSVLRGLLDYAWALVETMEQFHDRLYLDTESFSRTIGVPTAGISSTDFKITDVQKEELFQNGRQAAEQFLAHDWTFEGYVAAFRMGQAADRRQMVSEQMRLAAARHGPALAGI